MTDFIPEENVCYLYDNIRTRELLGNLLGGIPFKTTDYAYIKVNLVERTWETTFNHQWLYLTKPPITTLKEIKELLKKKINIQNMENATPTITMNRSLRRKVHAKVMTAIKNGDWRLIKELQPALDKLLLKPDNLILLSDGYKYSHHKFYGTSMTKMISYVESRGGKFSETLFYGLQYFLKRYLENVAIIPEEIDEASEMLANKLGVFGRDDVFDRSKFDYIVEKYGGKLPISIKAVPEGTVVGTKNVLMIIESLDENCAWLTNFLESLLLQVWYPITVGTLSREVKKVITKAFLKCTDYRGELLETIVGYVLNDFGFRGVSSVQSAAIGGSAHLVNFAGSDTVIASHLIMENYNTDTVFGKSIPATEHSIMTLRGEEGELEMMRNTLLAHPTQMVACVSDSFNIFRGCSQYWGTDLKEMILARPATAPLVIRPDSGHVTRTLIEVFNILFDKFGYTVNNKGYKVLPPQVRVIQGDGVNFESIGEIYAILDEAKISPENLALGMGGKLLQAGIDRDTQNFATKACSAIVDGLEKEIVKAPTEMDADGNLHKSFKTSKKGKMKLVRNEDGKTFRTVLQGDPDYESAIDELVEVYRMGVILVEHKFEDIRERALLDIEALELEVA